MFEVGAKDIIEKILPVIDNFERGLGKYPGGRKGRSFCSMEWNNDIQTAHE